MSEPSLTMYRLADSIVHLIVAPTPDGPQPMVRELDGTSYAIGYVQEKGALRDLPDGAEIFRIQVGDLVGQLPEGIGLWLDPEGIAPVLIPAADREAIARAAQPFPPGAQVRLGEAVNAPAEFVAALRRHAQHVPPLRRVFLARYQVADAREKLLAVHETDGGAADDVAATGAVLTAAEEANLDLPMQVLPLAEVPAESREWLVASISPRYERVG